MSTVINSIALWLTTVLVAGMTIVMPTGQTQQGWGYVLTLVFVALVFGIVNGTIGRVLRFLAFPIYVLTLGLMALVVNALLLMFVGWLTQVLGFGYGLEVETFGAGFLGAIVLSLVSWVLGLILRPAAGA
ncbi:MAG: putative membrane protein [Alpinimonas sp.]